MLPILPLRLNYQLDDSIRLPRYAGSLWRSAIGAHLRRHACVTGAETCDGCPLLSRCAYGYLFDTPQPMQGGDGLAQYQQVPHPYVLSPRHDRRDYNAGDMVTIDLILVEPAQRFLPDLLAAIRQLRLGNALLQLDYIERLRCGQDILRTPEKITPAQALDARPALPQPPSAPQTARIVFEHPLRLRRANQYLSPRDFDFRTFFTNLMRRVSMLHVLANPEPLQADFAALATTAGDVSITDSDLRWLDWHRKSARQHKRIPMGGIIGSIDIKGDLAPLWPWLWIGQWLHAGKGAVMGLGRYHIEIDP